MTVVILTDNRVVFMDFNILSIDDFDKQIVSIYSCDLLTSLFLSHIQYLKVIFVEDDDFVNIYKDS
ncbi:MAG TPA: hypothetical protein DF610_11230 [Sphingobacterium sp.]|jgi:hypothetical protein|nr:hypothetical protein BN1088_1431332 [Sphingobacterium sp. PM2-P1-29]HCU45347.1 hypothetical protein [Sphingobacterium sp.]